VDGGGDLARVEERRRFAGALNDELHEPARAGRIVASSQQNHRMGIAPRAS
jgi:hypothetical protein